MEESRPRELTAEELVLTSAGGTKADRESAPALEPPVRTSTEAATPAADATVTAPVGPVRQKRPGK